MAAILRSRQTFFTGSDTGSWIYQQDNHWHFLFIDALAEILMGIYQFQYLAYFVTWWRHRWRHVVWNITGTIRYRQLYTCKIMLVWHHIWNVWTNIMTNIGRHTQTSKHKGWKHNHLLIAGENHRTSHVTGFIIGLHSEINRKITEKVKLVGWNYEQTFNFAQN